ncbi:multiple sugar transport system permease protein [Devosia sp. UYZn731]|uniref:carbohydrate ABC transporter permease n=1 Tax=Devosia sp. UYZn731 TaxID=3156345 RepID=UPI003398C9E9
MGRTVSRIVLWLMAALVLGPVVWTIINAFKLNVDLLTPTPKLFFNPIIDNVTYVLGRPSVLQGLINSLVICISSVAIGVVFGLPTAYAVARYPNRWTEEIQFFVLSLRFMPPVAVAIPLMLIWLGIGLYDSQIALIITYSLLTISITVWLAIPGFQRVPKEIEEAARVDGYDAYAVFFRVALPVAMRTLLGALAFSFVLVWNEFLMALMLTTSSAKTLPIVASEMSQLGMNVPWGILNAAVVLLSLPPLLLLGLLSGFMNSIFSNKSR